MSHFHSYWLLTAVDMWRILSMEHLAMVAHVEALFHLSYSSQSYQKIKRSEKKKKKKRQLLNQQQI